MLQSFTIEISADSEEAAKQELVDIADAIIHSVHQLPWKCVEEKVYPYRSWIPGHGAHGDIQNYKGYMRFEWRGNH